MSKNKDFTLEKEYTLGFENSSVNPYAHIQCENLELEVESGEVNLNSFKKQKTLAPKIWKGLNLNPKIRLKLMDIADDFWEFCNITWVDVEDVILVGSICNFNWSEFSDVDLHLVVDFSKIHKRTDFVQEYFNEKKKSWNKVHSSLNIFGYPIELYVQDINAEVESGGIYDLWDNTWIRKPNKSAIKPIEMNKYIIKELAAELMTKIDDMYDSFRKEKDKHRLSEIDKNVDNLIDKIMTLRQKGLKDGEMGVGNIVYKCLRRAKYLDRLWKIKDKIYNKLNSINESYIFSREIRKDFSK